MKNKTIKQAIINALADNGKKIEPTTEQKVSFLVEEIRSRQRQLRTDVYSKSNVK
jgi:hypothetical protein